MSCLEAKVRILKNLYLKNLVFKDCSDFLDMTKGLGISRSTINFRVSLTKLVDKFPKMKKSSLP